MNVSQKTDRQAKAADAPRAGNRQKFADLYRVVSIWHANQNKTANTYIIEIAL